MDAQAQYDDATPFYELVPIRSMFESICGQTNIIHRGNVQTDRAGSNSKGPFLSHKLTRYWRPCPICNESQD